MARQQKSSQHVLERRAGMLAEKLNQRVKDFADTLQAANGRVPFKTKMTKNGALDWWSKHRYDQFGMKALQSLDAPAIANLDAALADYQRTQQEQGIPVESDASGTLPYAAPPVPPQIASTNPNGGF